MNSTTVLPLKQLSDDPEWVSFLVHRCYKYSNFFCSSYHIRWRNVDIGHFVSIHKHEIIAGVLRKPLLYICSAVRYISKFAFQVWKFTAFGYTFELFHSSDPVYCSCGYEAIDLHFVRMSMNGFKNVAISIDETFCKLLIRFSVDSSWIELWLRSKTKYRTWRVFSTRWLLYSVLRE